VSRAPSPSPIKERLAALGYACLVSPLMHLVYAQSTSDLTGVRTPKTAHGLGRLLARQKLSLGRIVCISLATAEALAASAHHLLHIAKRPNEASLFAALHAGELDRRGALSPIWNPIKATVKAKPNRLNARLRAASIVAGGRQSRCGCRRSDAFSAIRTR
jgi:hypothetical protein